MSGRTSPLQSMHRWWFHLRRLCHSQSMGLPRQCSSSSSSTSTSTRPRTSTITITITTTITITITITITNRSCTASSLQNPSDQTHRFRQPGKTIEVEHKKVINHSDTLVTATWQLRPLQCICYPHRTAGEPRPRDLQ